MTGSHLVGLRSLGAIAGLVFILWSFGRFRLHLIRRRDFFLMSLVGAALLLVAVYPDSINILAGLLSLEDKQFGRLIALLILSNVLLWFFLFGVRGRASRNSVQIDLLVRAGGVQRFLDDEGRRGIKEITVVVPAFNEAGNLKEVLPRIPLVVGGRPLGCLVVDDGSEDDTVQMVKDLGLPVAASPFNRGGGAALRLGFDIAIAAGARIVVTMDADGQHRPEEIPLLVEPILQEKADFVIGSRVLGERERDSLVRWVGIHVFNAVINLLAGIRVTDCSSGFRAFRVEALRKVILLQDQFHTAEFIIDAARKGLRIREVPVSMRRRLAGESKKGRNLAYGFSFSKTILKTWLRK